MTALRRDPGRASGFTLIELLVVIAIIGSLAVFLLPRVMNLWAESGRAVTESRILMVRQMIEKFERMKGEYPPSDLTDPMEGVKVKVDSINTGVESLVIHLHQWNLGASLSLDDKQEWLQNTDEDDNGAEIPELGTSKKLEIVDAWFTPLVYFNCDSYTKPQTVMLGGEDDEGETVVVKARKGDRGYLNKRKYQIISLGEDKLFGTEDDICYPK